MENASSLFRVFDLAFFVPGAALLVASWQMGLLPELRENGARGDVIAAVAAIVLVYAFGLICHAIARAALLLSDWPTKLKGDPRLPWYRSVEEKVKDLATYFWYLRSVCWNFAVALALLAGFALAQHWKMAGSTRVCCVLLLGASVALVLLGGEYDLALRKASNSARAYSNPIGVVSLVVILELVLLTAGFLVAHNVSAPSSGQPGATQPAASASSFSWSASNRCPHLRAGCFDDVRS